MTTALSFGVLRKPLVVLILLFACISSCGSFSPNNFESSTGLDNDHLLQAQKLVRHLLQTSDVDVIVENSTAVLAENRTNRKDPLDSLNIYRGGWDLTNEHYWASVGYTGLPAYIIAVIWAFLGILGLLFLCCWCCCCRSRKNPEYDHGRLGYILPILLLVFFTAVAVAGCVILYYGQAKFNDELEDTLDFVVQQSTDTEEGLRRVSRNLTRASEINIDDLFTLSQADKDNIQRLNERLNDSANTLSRETESNASDIRDIIDIVRIVLIVVAAVMLLLVLLGLLFSACGIRSVVYMLVVIGWNLVTATWILCGIFIFLNNAIGDTCVAMSDWVDRPFSNTSLDEILPCADPSTANSALDNSRDYTDKLVSLANTGITTVANGNFPPGTPTWYNQTGPFVPTVCEVYGPAPEFNLLPCLPPQLTLEQAPANWSEYRCVTNGDGICQTRGRLTNSTYEQLRVAVEVGRGLVSDATFLVSVANCSFVRDTFTDIRSNNCHDLRKYAKYIWIGLILVSGGTMLSILAWIVYIRRKRYRYSSKRSKQGPPPYNGLDR